MVGGVLFIAYDRVKEILSNAHVYNNTKDCNAIVVQIG